MIEIVLCDDDDTDLHRMETLLEEYKKKNPDKEIMIYTYSSAKDLLFFLQEGASCDIYILDILMPGCNGVELGHYIRQQNINTPIIYTTSSKEFALQAYGVCALRYLMKPVKKDELFSALDFAVKNKPKKEEDVFLVKTKQNITAVPVQNIVCVENISRILCFTLKDSSIIESICNRESFEKHLSPLIENFAFIQPHKSFLVNMNYIQSISSKELYLDNGKRIPISRNNSKSTKTAYLKYLSLPGRREDS